jgi:hypothetical protein
MNATAMIFAHCCETRKISQAIIFQLPHNFQLNFGHFKGRQFWYYYFKVFGHSVHYSL